MVDSTLSPSSLPGNQGNRSPLVSVCIPVYNCERYIGEAIQSVLDQTLADFELIVCDDCSTDGTLKAVEGCRDPRIRIFRNDANIGTWPELEQGDVACARESTSSFSVRTT